MNAYEIPNLRFSIPAGAAVPRHRFVSVNSDGLAVAAKADTPVIGASMNEVTDSVALPATKQIAEIADGLVVVEAAGAITAGAAVYSDAEGKATGTGEKACGTAITGVTEAGALVTVKIA